MTASAQIGASTRNAFSDGLITCGVAWWSVILLLTWVTSKEVALTLLVGTVALGTVGLMVSRPVVVLYVLTALGPFYDLSRAFLFPGVELVGFWQDALVAILWIAAIRNVLRHGIPKLIWLDWLVLGFIAAYSFSIVVSADSRVWFYGFRWFVLYPSMYLALRALEFSEKQRTRVMVLLGGSLIVSAIVGLLAMWYLGWDAAADLYHTLNLEYFARNDQWRWAATFSNPIITSSAFALLFCCLWEFSNFTKRRGLCVWGCGFAAGCLYLTHSRSGIVIAAVGSLVILFAIKSRYARPLLAVAVVASMVLAIQVVRSFDEWDDLRLQQFTRTVEEAFTTYPMGTGGGHCGSGFGAMAAASFAGQDARSVDTVVGDSVILTGLRGYRMGRSLLLCERLLSASPWAGVLEAPGSGS